MGCVRPRFNSWQPDKCMKYNIKDRVYGEIEISEPMLVEIINSPSLQRLKKISQAGYFEPYFPGTWHSRFEHSLGVCILLKKYGASIEEQIAGLIHDVSHSAFSHCIDYVLSAGSEKEHCHQDNVFYDYIKKTEIPEILRKYNFDVEYILDESNFPLEEKNLPQLCADRIDYSLRTALVFNEIDGARFFLENLYVEDREDGGSLSQGQKQLLCITRVMLSLPPMLILDEATSSIDTRTEIRIQKAFASMMEGRTSFIVAHRLSTIQNADIILVMKDGHIIEQGNHEELLQKKGFYAELYNSQFALA